MEPEPPTYAKSKGMMCFRASLVLAAVVSFLFYLKTFSDVSVEQADEWKNYILTGSKQRMKFEWNTPQNVPTTKIYGGLVVYPKDYNEEASTYNASFAGAIAEYCNEQGRILAQTESGTCKEEDFSTDKLQSASYFLTFFIIAMIAYTLNIFYKLVADYMMLYDHQFEFWPPAPDLKTVRMLFTGKESSNDLPFDLEPGEWKFEKLWIVPLVDDIEEFGLCALVWKSEDEDENLFENESWSVISCKFEVEKTKEDLRADLKVRDNATEIEDKFNMMIDGCLVTHDLLDECENDNITATYIYNGKNMDQHNLDRIIDMHVPFELICRVKTDSSELYNGFNIFAFDKWLDSKIKSKFKGLLSVPYGVLSPVVLFVESIIGFVFILASFMGITYEPMVSRAKRLSEVWSDSNDALFTISLCILFGLMFPIMSVDRSDLVTEGCLVACWYNMANPLVIMSFFVGAIAKFTNVFLGLINKMKNESLGRRHFHTVQQIIPIDVLKASNPRDPGMGLQFAAKTQVCYPNVVPNNNSRWVLHSLVLMLIVYLVLWILLTCYSFFSFFVSNIVAGVLLGLVESLVLGCALMALRYLDEKNVINYERTSRLWLEMKGDEMETLNVDSIRTQQNETELESMSLIAGSDLSALTPL